MELLDPKTLKGLHCFYHPYSDCSQRVMLMLAEKGIDAEMHLIDLGKSEQLSDAYRRITPKCEVPAIVHEGKAMHESLDLIRYIEENFSGPRFIPEDTDEKNKMEEFLEAAASAHEEGVIHFLYTHGLGRLPTPSDWEFYQRHIPHREKFHRERRSGWTANDRTAALKTLKAQFTKLETALEESEWLAGNTYSLADIVWFPHVITMRIFGYAPNEYPNIAKWVKRIE